ncbi:MAG: hypothetical protein D6784_04575, partial [Chloroflexi bacterium]
MSTLLNYTYRYPFLFRNLFWTLPLLFLAATRRIHHLDWVAAAVLLALVPWLTRRTGVNARLTGPLLALLSAGVLGLLVSYNFYVSLPAFLTLLGSTALFFAIVSSGLPPRLLAEGTVLVVVLVAVLYAVAWFAGGGLEVTSLNALAGVLEVAFLPALVLTA